MKGSCDESESEIEVFENSNNYFTDESGSETIGSAAPDELLW